MDLVLSLKTSFSMTLANWRLFVLLFVFFAACKSGTDLSSVNTFDGSIMGTTFMVTIAKSDLKKEDQNILRSLIEYELIDVDEKMSTYRSDSEVSRFNRNQTTKPFFVSEETLAVFQHALDVSKVSEGAFDVTVGPIVDAWGFGPLDRRDDFPTNEEIERLKENVGYQYIEIDSFASTVRKLNSLISVDLSGLAKGYAVDRVAELLELQGFHSYLVEVGGEIRAAGQSSRGDFWRVGIERPVSDAPVLQRLVNLRNLSLATSGNYRNYFELDGKRYSHTIDPRTGRPVNHRLASVSVIQTLCVKADAIATALQVMGPEKGLELALEYDWPVLLITQNEDGTFSEHETPRFTSVS